MAPPRNKVNHQIEFKMNRELMKELTVDEMMAIGDILSNPENTQVLIMNTRPLRTFLARFVWDGKQYLDASAAWDAMGPMRYDQMIEAVQEVFTATEEEAVPPTSGADS